LVDGLGAIAEPIRISDRLRMRGWQVPTYPFTGDLATTDFQRILVKRGFTREMAGGNAWCEAGVGIPLWIGKSGGNQKS
jgi:hypothetical protein